MVQPKKYTPIAIFDQVEYLKNTPPDHLETSFLRDYEIAKQFLLSYQHNAATFTTYRREIERLCQYSWFMKQQSFIALTRQDIESYLGFCQKPPVEWIGTKTVARFFTHNGERRANPEWRPFTVHLAKQDRYQGKRPNKNLYCLSEKALKEIFVILNGFYTFLLQEEIASVNPIAQIKQKNRFYRVHQGKTKIRRISELQWRYVLETAERMATQEPEKHERTLFILTVLYGLYLRISELVASPRWTPTMNDFEKDHQDHWWFVTVGKGNKERRIAVSPFVLEALKRWRRFLRLSPEVPTINDQSPLISKQRGQGPVTDTRHIRRIMQNCFGQAGQRLRQEGYAYDADALVHATVHWLRHTGISDDVKFRPREHVRDDAGHSSSNITDKYIDVNLEERYASAQHKKLKKELKMTDP